MTTLTEPILSTFPECLIAPLEGIPMHTYMTEFNGFLNACAASVHFNLGNYNVGYLVLTSQSASFAIASLISFVKPVNPGVLVLAEPAPSAAIIRTLTRQHIENMRVFNEYYSVNKACKKFLFTLFPEAYFWLFKKKYTGYANIKCLDILTHLWTTYGVLQGFEVQENNLRMKQPITAEKLFEDFVKQIETAVDVVAT